MMLYENVPCQSDVEGSACNIMEIITHLCIVLVKNCLHVLWETNQRLRKDVKASVYSHRRNRGRVLAQQFVFLHDGWL